MEGRNLKSHLAKDVAFGSSARRIRRVRKAGKGGLWERIRIHPLTQERMYTWRQAERLLERAGREKRVILGGDVMDLRGRHTHMNWYYQLVGSPEDSAESIAVTQRYIRALVRRNEKSICMFWSLSDRAVQCWVQGRKNRKNCLSGS